MRKNNRKKKQLNDKNLQIYLKTYEISNNRTIEGTKEFYEFSTIILMVLVAILGIQHWWTESFLLVLGLILSFVWFAAVLVQIMWKRWWETRNRKIEENIFNSSTKGLKNIRKIGIKDAPKLRFNFVFGLFPIIFCVIFFQELLPFQISLSLLFSDLTLWKQYAVWACECYSYLSYFYLFYIELLFILVYVSYLYKPFLQHQKWYKVFQRKHQKLYKILDTLDTPLKVLLKKLKDC